jgi:hypothetical protein
MVVNHLDGLTQHNHVSNLQYCTQQENMQHAHSTGLIPLVKPNAGREVHKFELDGTYIETLPRGPSGTAAFIHKHKSGRALHHEGYLWSYDTSSEFQPAAVTFIFPDYDATTAGVIDWEVVRPYIVTGHKPILHIDFDGTVLAIYKGCNEAAATLETTPATIYQQLDRISGNGIFQYARLSDILTRPLRKDVSSQVHQHFQVEIAKSDDRSDLDYTFLREYAKNCSGGPRPILQMEPVCLKPIRKWVSASVAERALGLGRSVVDQAARREKYTPGGFRWCYTDFTMIK